LLKIDINKKYDLYNMTTSKPYITWLEITAIVCVCAIIGSCVYVSLRNVPVRHTTTETKEVSTLKIANTESSAPMLVTIPVPKSLKLVTIISETK